MPIVKNPGETKTEHLKAPKEKRIIVDHYDVGKRACILIPYFNPCMFDSRVDNFSIFYHNIKELDIDIKVGEIALHKRAFQVGDIVDKDDLVFQSTISSILWHEPQIINLLYDIVRADDYGIICWVYNCDFVIKDYSGLFDEIVNALSQYRVVQVGGRCMYLPYGIESFSSIDLDTVPKGREICHAEDMFMKNYIEKEIANGMSEGLWCVRRQLMNIGGIYPSSIVQANKHMAQAIICNHISQPFIGQYTTKHLIDYFNYANKISDYVNSSIGYIDRDIFKLYSGNIQEQDIIESTLKQQLKHLKYTPKKDIIKEDGFYRLTEDGKRLSKPIEKAFFERKEDG